MNVIETPIAGLLVIEPKVFRDERGFFMEPYNKRLYDAHGVAFDFIQDNHARSEARGVLRGLHFQAPPMAQAKLVRVSRGAVYDVAVDLREGSPTYGHWHGLELSAENFRQFLIPAGFAHGYQTLVEGTEFLYKVDNYYSPQDEGGLRWDDPDLNIPWPLADPVLADRDRRWPRLRELATPFGCLDAA